MFSESTLRSVRSDLQLQELGSRIRDLEFDQDLVSRRLFLPTQKSYSFELTRHNTCSLLLVSGQQSARGRPGRKSGLAAMTNLVYSTHRNLRGYFHLLKAEIL